MNFNRAILYILVFLIGCVSAKKTAYSESESYSRKELKAIAEWKYGFNLKADSLCDLYLLDGIIYDNIGIDSVLSKYDKSEIGSIWVIKLGEDQTWWDNECELLTLIQKKHQSEKEKSKVLNKVKGIYNENVSSIKITDYKCSNCPLLSINNTLIYNPYKQKKIINELTTKDIDYIIRIDQKLNPAYYGENAENGIVEISLK